MSGTLFVTLFCIIVGVSLVVFFLALVNKSRKAGFKKSDTHIYGYYPYNRD